MKVSDGCTENSNLLSSLVPELEMKGAPGTIQRGLETLNGALSCLISKCKANSS